jgi:hypothetical protein
MNLQCRSRKSLAALAMASHLMFAASFAARGESPKWCFEDGGTSCPILLSDLGWNISYFYAPTENDFLRRNPDGSYWWHEQGNNIPISLYYVDGEQWTEIFSGYGKFELGCTAAVGPGWWAADGQRFEYRVQATLTDLATGEEYPFFFHWVIRDWVWVVDDLRFAPLGAGK